MVMPTTPTTRNTRAQNVDDQFLDLICHDADLLAAEFDAIIAAARLSPPPAQRPTRGPTDRRPTSPADSRPIPHGQDTICPATCAGVGERARQRSPPVRTRRPTTDTEGR